MERIYGYDLLPKPIGAMARTFLGSDEHEPEVYKVTPQEYKELIETQEGDAVVTQLLHWREYNKFYATLAGTAERKTETQIMLAGPLYKKCSILAFHEIPLEELTEWNRQYGDLAIEENTALELE